MNIADVASDPLNPLSYIDKVPNKIFSNGIFSSERISSYLTPEQVNILRNTPLEEIKSIPHEVISDYQFNQIFGYSKKEYIDNLSKIIESKRKGLPQRAKDMFIKQDWDSNLKYQQRIAQSIENMKYNYTDEDLVNESKNILKDYFNSDRYKNRLMLRGIPEDEIDWITRKYINNIDNVKQFLTNQAELITKDKSGFRITKGADGIYSKGSHSISTLFESPLSTKMHELSHASDLAEEVPYNVQIRMTPNKNSSDFDYYSDPTEQRARAIVTDIEAQKRGMTIEEYLELPYNELNSNTQQLLDNFDKEQLMKYLKGFAGISTPILISNLSNKNSDK